MKLRPIGDHLIVKPSAQEAVSASGIIIPETATKERSERGEIVAVGEGKYREDGTRQPIELKVGDVVVFKKYAPDEIKIDGVEYLIIRAEDVMAVLEN